MNQLIRIMNSKKKKIKISNFNKYKIFFNLIFLYLFLLSKKISYF
jgi:hypothetical protein